LLCSAAGFDLQPDFALLLAFAGKPVVRVETHCPTLPRNRQLMLTILSGCGFYHPLIHTLLADYGTAETRVLILTGLLRRAGKSGSTIEI